jgi:OPT oligopeptide transporter protein
MIWPALLATTTLLNTLHNRRNPVADGWKISRYRFFLYITVVSFLWYFIPGFVFPALSTFAFVTWIFPKNVTVNQLFGMTTGMALLPFTFDWSQISGFLGSPLTTPWFAAGNVVLGLVLWIWIVCPILHFWNIWEGLYFPFSSYNLFNGTYASNGAYDNTQKQYDVIPNAELVNSGFENSHTRSHPR